MRVLFEGPADEARAAAAEWVAYAEARGRVACDDVTPARGDERVDRGEVLKVVLALPAFVIAVDTLAAKLKQRDAEAEDERRELEARHPRTRVTLVPGEGQWVEFPDDPR